MNQSKLRAAIRNRPFVAPTFVVWTPEEKSERGVFADDPTWDDFQTGIEEYRESMNEIDEEKEK